MSSRLTKLLGHAVMNSKPPVSRLYFDTEPLTHGNWPFLSHLFDHCLLLAFGMGVEICIPEAALHERAEQWVRETLGTLGEARESATIAHKAVKELALRTTIQVPTEEEVRVGYAKAESEAIEQYRVRRVSYPRHPLNEVFQMAVCRGFTFEEKRDGVVGLQDCVILLSALEHLEANPAPARFVSSDGIFFRRPGLAPQGASFGFIRGLKELQTLLMGTVEKNYNAELRRLWKETSERIQHALENHRADIRSFIDQRIDKVEFDKLFGRETISRQLTAVKTFGAIVPDLRGESADPINFSCDLDVSFRPVLSSSCK